MNIGCGIQAEIFAGFKDHLVGAGVLTIEKGSDGSEFQHQYVLSNRNEPFGMTEYV